MNLYTLNFKIIFLAMLLCTSLVHAKDGDIKVSGRIQNINSASVTLGNNNTYYFSDDTEFENAAGQAISISKFSVGNLVEVKYKIISDLAVVRELKLKSNGSNSNSDDDDNSNVGDDTPIDLSSFRKALRRISGTNTTSSGRINFRSKIEEDRSEQRFIVKMYVRIPSTIPALASADDVNNLEILATLSRNNVPYAECFMPFDHTEIKSVGLVAEYKSDVRRKIRSDKPTRFTSKNGSYCDIDLATTGVQNGLPIIEAGDTVVVSEQGSGNLLEAEL